MKVQTGEINEALELLYGLMEFTCNSPEDFDKLAELGLESFSNEIAIEAEAIYYQILRQEPPKICVSGSQGWLLD